MLGPNKQGNISSQIFSDTEPMPPSTHTGTQPALCLASPPGIPLRYDTQPENNPASPAQGSERHCCLIINTQGVWLLPRFHIVQQQPQENAVALLSCT